MKMMMTRLISTIALVLACTALSVAAADITLTGETEYAVASGSAVSVAERITGSGSILKTGEGELLLSNSGNDFTGGATVSAGTLTVSAEGSLGSGAATASDASATLAFKAAATAADGFAAFANALSFTGDTDVGYGGTDGNGDGKYNVIFYKDTRLTGDVTATRAFRLRHNPVSTSNPSNGGPSTVFDGRINAVGMGVYLNLYGTMTANGAITAALLSGGEAWSGGGSLVLKSPENRIGELVVCNNTVACGAANVLGGAKVTWRQSSGTPVYGLASVNLAGFDQTVAGLSQHIWGKGRSGWNGCYTHSGVGKNGNTYCVYSSAAATLTVTGGSEDLVTYAPLAGAVSLVMDAAEHPSFTQTFTQHASAFTGATEIRAGTLALAGTARFTKTPSLTVAAGAKVLCGSTAANPAFESVKSLVVNGDFDASGASVCPFASALETVSIGDGATLALPSGSVLAVKSLTVNGQTYTVGRFAPETLPNLTGGSIVVSGGEARQADWTGAKSETLTDVGNWDDPQVDLKYGSFAAVFAKSGSAATVDSDVAVHEILFRAADGEAGFTLSRSEPANAITVGPHISAITNDLAATAHTYVIDNPIKVAGDLTLHADTNQTLVIRNALRETADDVGLHALTVDGRDAAANVTGRVAFEGTNVFAGSLMVTTSLVRISGAFRNPDDAYTGSPADFDAKAISVNLTSTGAKAGQPYGILLENATVGKSVFIANKMGVPGITAAAGTTNEISGYVRYRDYSWETICVEKNAELVLSGGLLGVHSFRKFGPGTLVIRDRPVDCQASAGFNPNEGRVVFEVAGNVVNYLDIGYNDYGAVTVEMAVDNAFAIDEAFTNAYVQIGGKGGTVASCEALANGTYTWDLRGTVQRCSKLAVLKRGVLTGEWPARVDVLKGWVDGDPDGYRYVSGQVTGGVGLCQAGVGTLTVTNALASCGDLAVTAGALEFAEKGSWMNGTNVTVSGSGTLRLANGTHFNGKAAVLHLGADGDDWQIDIPAGVSHTFAAIYDSDGNRLSAGTYGNASSGATFTRYASHFPNGGKVSARLTGLVLSVR